MSVWTALEATETTGEERSLSGYYLAFCSEVGSATVKLQVHTNGAWRDTSLSFDSGSAAEQVFAGAAGFRFRFVSSAAGPVVEVGLIDRASLAGPV